MVSLLPATFTVASPMLAVYGHFDDGFYVLILKNNKEVARHAAGIRFHRTSQPVALPHNFVATRIAVHD